MSEWEPTTAELRDGETTDENTHAKRNLEQIKMGVESGALDEDDLSEEMKERLD